MSATTAQVPANTARAAAARRRLSRIVPQSGVLAAGLVIVGAIVLFGLIGPFFTQSTEAVSPDLLAAPSAAHWLGTTQAGQDVFAQLAQATRGSLLVGLIVGVLATALSVLFGVFGAYAGGRVDEGLSLFTNVVLVIPGLPLLIVITTYLSSRGLFTVAVVLAITGWAASSRVLRAQTLSLREREYVTSARAIGEKAWRVVLVEILPNLLPVIASQFVFAVIFAILGEAGLSFLGLGGIGDLTWGSMLFYAQNAQAIVLGAWWWFIPPGLLIAVLGCGLSLINFSIDEIINPELRTTAKLRRETKAKRKAS